MSKNATLPGAEDFFSGGGEMGRRIREFDWATHPLGPSENWPQSLKIVIRIMLTSRYAMWMGWGPEFYFFCNDAYLPTVGIKENWVLGASARKVWAEIWDDIGPRAESVVETGLATWDESLLLFLERSGYSEETYHTFSYSPVPNDLGGIGGMLCVVTEETERVIGERRLAALHDLAADLAAINTEEEIWEAVRRLDKHAKDLPFTLIYLFDEQSSQACLACSQGAASGDGVAPEKIDIQSSDAYWPARELLESGESVLVKDLAERLGSIPTGPWDKPARQALVAPIAQQGQERPAGFLIAGINPYRPLDEDYRNFIGLLAGQTAAALANARAYEAERKRAEALAELDRAKTAFFSNVSHEFRTPLTLMLGPLDDVLEKEGEMAARLLPEDRELLTVVRRNGQRLLKLVNTLLDFSRIEAGRAQAIYEPVDLAAYTAELASVFRAAIEKAEMRLIVDCPPLPEPVFVDRDMWEKIVLNLLSNAFKYTFEGEIEVRLRIEKKKGLNEASGEVIEESAIRNPQSAILTVRDTGRGIPASELPNIFNRFHRVEDARGRTHEGTGIGLALVQELVKLHGGTVSVESVLGRGSAFTVTVPLGKEHLPAERVGGVRTLAPTAVGASSFVEEALRWLPSSVLSVEPKVLSEDENSAAPGSITLDTQHSALSTQHSARILLADDNADMREYVRRLLADEYEVIAVADGEQALQAVDAHAPDLVLTDVMMPKLDGFELLRRLRADAQTALIPVILLSARAGEEARVEGLRAGADDYLIKPFNARELLARVAGTLALAKVRREAEERITRTVESITDGLVVLDREWRYTYVNAEAERLLRRTRADLLGKVIWDVFPRTVGTEIERKLHQIVATQMPEEVETFYAEWERWYENKIYPTPDGGVTIYFRDVTERKAAEQALKDADRRKDEFLATLAHELRNPLAPIRSALQIMRLAEGNREATVQAREVMERQLGQMVRLIDDLLDLSRISRGKIELRTEQVELSEVVRIAVEASRPVIEQADHTLTLDVPREPIFVNADTTRLAQVFANLLNNAAKYTDKGGQISLTVTPSKSNVTVSVKDSGVGIATDMLSQVFEMFAQVDRSLERSRGGLGIGLNIAKRLAEKHGGAIEARSEGLGKGSEFIVCLPTIASVTQPALPLSGEETSAESHAGRRILVADDNEDSASAMAMMLTLMGNEVRTASDGLEAVNQAESFRPQVIVLDIGMPELNGYDACRRIRQRPWAREVVMIALTGWGQDEDKRRSQEAGFDYHLVKPVDPDVLEKLLGSLK